jgi:hypothetical protein
MYRWQPMKYFLFPALVLAFSNAAHAAHWQHHVTLKDGSTWECWPHHDGTETCFDTEHAYTPRIASPHRPPF